MSDLLERTVDDLLRAHVPDTRDGWDQGLWGRLAKLGLISIGIDESDGGSGGTLADAATVVRVAARHAAALPLGESLIAATGFDVRSRAPADTWSLAAPVTNRPILERSGNGLVLTGRCAAVPWGSVVHHLLLLADFEEGCAIVVVNGGWALTRAATNIAGEPRDTLDFSGLTVDKADVIMGDEAGAIAVSSGALARAIQIAGALEGVMTATAGFISEREQFGQPLGRFQAVQQMMAELAEETMIARSAADSALQSFVLHDVDAGVDAIAAAKIRAGMAATVVARISHQLHGAIGFTYEHDLHHLTKRLWSWRDEYGSESYWARVLGERILKRGEKSLWSSIAG